MNTIEENSSTLRSMDKFPCELPRTVQSILDRDGWIFFYTDEERIICPEVFSYEDEKEDLYHYRYENDDGKIQYELTQKGYQLRTEIYRKRYVTGSWTISDDATGRLGVFSSQELLTEYLSKKAAGRDFHYSFPAFCRDPVGNILQIKVQVSIQ